MASKAVNIDLAAALDAVAAGLDLLQAAGVKPVNAADAVWVIRETEALARRMGAVQVDVLNLVDQNTLFAADGHQSGKVMVRHVAHLSKPEASRRQRVVRALRDMPLVRAAYRDGKIGDCQVTLIARVWANKRVRQQLIDLDERLARSAAMRSYGEFERILLDWRTQTDEDGTADTNERNHQNRDAKIVQDYDKSWRLAAGCAALNGAEMLEILRVFTEVEFKADWAAARAEWGDDAGEHLDRTHNQRRFDALLAIFRRGADALAAAVGGSEIVTNIVIDEATFTRYAAKLFGAIPQPATPDFDPNLPDDLDSDLDSDLDGDLDAEPDAEPEGEAEADDGEPVTGDPEINTDVPAPTAPVGFRCSTLDGHPLDPTEAVAYALLGHVRRVVVGADSTVIDLGRRRRLFTGAAQLAVKLQSQWCYWPGCHTPVSHCQSDHIRSWEHQGRTNPGNGGPACGKHNRLKQHGYSVNRDQAGNWHVHKPDGTEIE